MRLTSEAWDRLPAERRSSIGARLTYLATHPGTGRNVIVPVDIVPRVLPRDCEHVELAVSSTLTLARLARCRTCGAGGPTMPRHTDDAAVRSAFLALYPRASFRAAVDDRGVMVGWAERIGDRWCAFSCLGADAPATAVGAFATADEACGLVFARWGRSPSGKPEVSR